MSDHCDAPTSGVAHHDVEEYYSKVIQKRDDLNTTVRHAHWVPLGL